MLSTVLTSDGNDVGRSVHQFVWSVCPLVCCAAVGNASQTHLFKKKNENRLFNIPHTMIPNAGGASVTDTTKNLKTQKAKRYILPCSFYGIFPQQGNGKRYRLTTIPNPRFRVSEKLVYPNMQ